MDNIDEIKSAFLRNVIERRGISDDHVTGARAAQPIA